MTDSEMTLEQVRKLAERERIHKRPDTIREEQEYKQLFIENIDFTLESTEIDKDDTGIAEPDDKLLSNQYLAEELSQNITEPATNNVVHEEVKRRNFLPTSILYLGLLATAIYLLYPLVSSRLHDITLSSQRSMKLPEDPSLVKAEAATPITKEVDILVESDISIKLEGSSLAQNILTHDEDAIEEVADKQTQTIDSDANKKNQEFASHKSSLSKIDKDDLLITTPDVADKRINTNLANNQQIKNAKNDGAKKVALLMHRAILDAVAFGRNASYVQKKENDLSSLNELHALTSDKYYMKQIVLTKGQVKELKNSLKKLSAVYAERIDNICNFRTELIPGALESINDEYIKSQGIERISLDFFKKQLNECSSAVNVKKTAAVLSKKYNQFMNSQLSGKGRNR